MIDKRLRVLAYVALAGLGIWGIVGVIQRFTLGHELANYGSYVPWGLWVSGYSYFVGLSAGAFFLASLIYVAKIEKLKRIVRPALLISVVTLAIALICILFDLGRMERFYEVFTRPNFTSLMAWMVWLYTLYFVLLLIELWFELRFDLADLTRSGGRLAPLYRILVLGWRAPDDPAALAAVREKNDRILAILGGIGIPLAVAFPGGVGALFAGLMARPYWHTALYPIFFLTGALVSGGALLLAVVAFSDLGKGEEGREALRILSTTVVALLLFDLLLEWSGISIPTWYRVGEHYDLLMVVLFGQFWYVFWIVHLLLGALVPLALLVWKRSSTTAVGVAGALIAVTFMAVRLNLVVPGQITPQLAGLENAYIDQRLLFEYMPSAFEWSVIAFVVVLGIALFKLGLRLLPITESHTR